LRDQINVVGRRQGARAVLRSDNPDRVSQAANSMVDVLDQVIDRVRGTKEFADYLAERFPKHAAGISAQRTFITTVKSSLHTVKHHTQEQPPELAEHLMEVAESIIRMLLR
jgi:hypothetical protein